MAAQRTAFTPSRDVFRRDSFRSFVRVFAAISENDCFSRIERKFVQLKLNNIGESYSEMAIYAVIMPK